MASLDPVVFYFDFTNPYAYFASLTVDDIGKRQGRKTLWKPVLGSVPDTQTDGLLVQSQSASIEYTMHDVARIARLHRVELDVQHPLAKPVLAETAYVWLFDQSHRIARNFAEAIFHAHWRQGQNIADPDVIGDCAAAAGQDPQSVKESLTDSAAVSRLHQMLQDSFARDIFGAPTMMVDGESFWGWDRMAMAEAWLENGGW